MNMSAGFFPAMISQNRPLDCLKTLNFYNNFGY